MKERLEYLNELFELGLTIPSEEALRVEITDREINLLMLLLLDKIANP